MSTATRIPLPVLRLTKNDAGPRVILNTAGAAPPPTPPPPAPIPQSPNPAQQSLPPIPQSAIPIPQSAPPDPQPDLNEILFHYFAPNLSLVEVASLHGLTVAQLIAWLDQPHIQKLLDNIERATARRDHLNAVKIRHKALFSLQCVIDAHIDAETHQLLQPTPAAHAIRHRLQESGRRASGAIIRWASADPEAPPSSSRARCAARATPSATPAPEAPANNTSAHSKAPPPSMPATHRQPSPHAPGPSATIPAPNLPSSSIAPTNGASPAPSPALPAAIPDEANRPKDPSPAPIPSRPAP